MLTILPKCDPILMIKTAEHVIMFQALEINDVNALSISIGITWDNETKILQSITKFDLESHGTLKETHIDRDDVNQQVLVDKLKSFI